MLQVATFLGRSAIHGTGCFAARAIAEGTLVWCRSPEVDSTYACVEQMTHWERTHAYRSHQHHNRWILPRDNAAWINFATTPNLVELAFADPDAEPALIARTRISPGQELTVGSETDADAQWKLSLP
jgi:SET domain-containing protein